MFTLRKNLKVDALPEFANIFKSSQSTSRKLVKLLKIYLDDTGRFHYLLRKSNKRKHSMIEDDEKDMLKQKIEEVKEEKFRLDEEIMRSNSQIGEYLQERLGSEENEEKLLRLYEAGIIDKDGNLIQR